MSEQTIATESVDTPGRTPWHLWLIGILALLWDAVGAFDYVATQFRMESYLSQFTPEQLEFFFGFPAWVVAFWALAVWGGVLGSVLLLMRKRLAVVVLLTSFLSMVVTTIHNFFIVDGLEYMGAGGAAFSGVIFLIALGLWIYARAMAGREVLA